MPFTSDGIVPDLMINPHAIPSRMTIAQLIECILGKVCSIIGGFGDGTAFMNTSVENITRLLQQNKFEIIIDLNPVFHLGIARLISFLNSDILMQIQSAAIDFTADWGSIINAIILFIGTSPE